MKNIRRAAAIGLIAGAIALQACTQSPQPSAKDGVENLFADYGFYADNRDTETVKAYFVEDSELDVPSANANVQGRDGVAALYGQAWKAVTESGQQRRHVITGIRVFDETDSTVSFRAIMNVLGTPADGQPQVYMTGVYNGEAVLTKDGWKFKRLQILVD